MKFLATFSSLVLALVNAGAVAALPTSANPTTQCATGSIRCCNSVQPASSDAVSHLLDALKLNLDADENVGLECDPISTSAVGGGQTCNAMPLWLAYPTGALSIGCSPVPLIL